MKKFKQMTPEQQSAIKKAFSTHDGVNYNALQEAMKYTEFKTVKICVETFGISPALATHCNVLHILA